MGDTDFQLVAVKEQVSQVRHHARWRRRSGSPHRENWADLRPVLPVGVGIAARRAAGGSLPSAFTGRRHGARSAANGVCHSNVRITPNAGIPAEKEPPRNWGSFPPPAFGGLCRPEVGPVLPVGAPLPARRSAWWHGRHAPVQRPRGAFCDSASAPEVEKCGLAACEQSHVAQFSRWGLEWRCIPAGPHLENWPPRSALLIVALWSKYTRYFFLARLVSRAPYHSRHERHFVHRLLG